MVCFIINNIKYIYDQEIRILKHSRKALLFDSKDIWIKNSENPMFDVTMGSLDGVRN